MVQKLWSKEWKSSVQRRKQRKYIHNAPLHVRHKMMGCMLSSELKKKYSIGAVPVRVGDTVKVMRGNSKNKIGKVTKVTLANLRVFVEGVEVSRIDGSKALYPIHPSNLVITKLDLSDDKRKKKIERAIK